MGSVWKCGKVCFALTVQPRRQTRVHGLMHMQRVETSNLKAAFRISAQTCMPPVGMFDGTLPLLLLFFLCASFQAVASLCRRVWHHPNLQCRPSCSPRFHGHALRPPRPAPSEWRPPQPVVHFSSIRLITESILCRTVSMLCIMVSMQLIYNCKHEYGSATLRLIPLTGRRAYCAFVEAGLISGVTTNQCGPKLMRRLGHRPK